MFPKNEEFRWNNYEKLERIKSTLVITDRALLLDAVKHYEDSLRHASEDLKNDKDLMIEVDGGITTDNIGKVVAAGADVLVAGSAVFKGGKVKENIAALKAQAK